MINNYIDKLLQHLQSNKNKKDIDLILDGGAFNGSYHVGVLKYLSKLLSNEIIMIHRISACSVGTIAAYLFLTDNLDKHYDIVYNLCYKSVTRKGDLSGVMKVKQYFDKIAPKNTLEMINKKLFISYYDFKRNKKVVVSNYKSIEELHEIIVRSCFIPIIVNNEIFYENRYLDGILPYVFKEKYNRKRLYVNLFSLDKVFNVMNIHKEKTAIHRVINGITDVHLFFVKKRSTSLCSYLEDWDLSYTINYIFKYSIELLIYFFFFIIYSIKRNIEKQTLKRMQKSVFYKILCYSLKKIIKGLC